MGPNKRRKTEVQVKVAKPGADDSDKIAPYVAYFANGNPKSAGCSQWQFEMNEASDMREIVCKQVLLKSIPSFH